MDKEEYIKELRGLYESSKRDGELVIALEMLEKIRVEENDDDDRKHAADI